MEQRKAQAALAGTSWATVLLTASVLMINFLPFYHFFPAAAPVKFAAITVGIFISLLLAIRQGVLLGMSDKAAPYVLYGLYFLWIIVSLVVNGEYANDPLTLVGVLVMQPAIVFASILLREHKRDFVRTVHVFAFLFFLHVAYRYFVLQEYIGVGNKGDISYQTVSIYLGMFVILGITRVKRSVWDLIYVTVGSLVGLFLMSASGSRGPALSVIIVTLIYFLFVYKNIKGKIIISTLTVLSLLVFYEIIYEFVTSSSVYARSVYALGEEDSTSRIFLFTKALELFAQNPFFGGGLNSFQAFIGRYDGGWYPHNIFLEIAASLGLIGLFFFLGYVFYCIYVFFRFYREATGYNQQAMFLFLYILIIYQFSGDLIAAWLFYLLLGMSLPSAHLRFAALRPQRRTRRIL